MYRVVWISIFSYQCCVLCEIQSVLIALTPKTASPVIINVRLLLFCMAWRLIYPFYFAIVMVFCMCVPTNKRKVKKLSKSYTSSLDCRFSCSPSSYVVLVHFLKVVHTHQTKKWLYYCWKEGKKHQVFVLQTYAVYCAWLSVSGPLPHLQNHHSNTSLFYSFQQ